MKTKKELTPLQQAFIDCLFDKDVGGDLLKAKKKAGYSDTTKVKEVLIGIEDEVIDCARSHISMSAPKAAMKLSGMLDNPSAVGSKELLAAVKDVLDRAGIVKTERIQIDNGGGVFIMPPKRQEEE